MKITAIIYDEPFDEAGVSKAQFRREFVEQIGKEFPGVTVDFSFTASPKEATMFSTPSDQAVEQKIIEIDDNVYQKLLR
jgi:hypothetical protein